MAFNVCDKEGNHMGIVTSASISWDYSSIYPLRVALTDQTTTDIAIDMDGITDFVAKLYQCTGVFGGINERKLEEKLLEIWQESYSPMGEINKDFLLKALFLRSNIIEVEKYCPLDPEKIKGYVLLDKSNIAFKDFDTIVLPDLLDYLDHSKNLLDRPPIFGKIISYPQISIEGMGAEGLLLGAGFADLGGRNHVHETKFRVLSGNVQKPVALPIQIGARKDMDILFYADKSHINAIICDGVIYRMK